MISTSCDSISLLVSRQLALPKMQHARNWINRSTLVDCASRWLPQRYTVAASAAVIQSWSAHPSRWSGMSPSTRPSPLPALNIATRWCPPCSSCSPVTYRALSVCRRRRRYDKSNDQDWGYCGGPGCVFWSGGASVNAGLLDYGSGGWISDALHLYRRRQPVQPRGGPTQFRRLNGDAVTLVVCRCRRLLAGVGRQREANEAVFSGRQRPAERRIDQAVVFWTLSVDSTGRR